MPPLESRAIIEQVDKPPGPSSMGRTNEPSRGKTPSIVSSDVSSLSGSADENILRGAAVVRRNILSKLYGDAYHEDNESLNNPGSSMTYPDSTFTPATNPTSSLSYSQCSMRDEEEDTAFMTYGDDEDEYGEDEYGEDEYGEDEDDDGDDPQRVLKDAPSDEKSAASPRPEKTKRRRRKKKQQQLQKQHRSGDSFEWSSLASSPLGWDSICTESDGEHSISLKSQPSPLDWDDIESKQVHTLAGTDGHGTDGHGVDHQRNKSFSSAEKENLNYSSTNLNYSSTNLNYSSTTMESFSLLQQSKGETSMFSETTGNLLNPHEARQRAYTKDSGHGSGGGGTTCETSTMSETTGGYLLNPYQPRITLKPRNPPESNATKNANAGKQLGNALQQHRRQKMQRQQQQQQQHPPPPPEHAMDTHRQRQKQPPSHEGGPERSGQGPQHNTLGGGWTKKQARSNPSTDGSNSPSRLRKAKSRKQEQQQQEDETVDTFPESELPYPPLPSSEQEKSAFASFALCLCGNLNYGW